LLLKLNHYRLLPFVDNNLNPANHRGMSKNPEITEQRRAQLRESQRRRRQELSKGNRHQVNIYLPKNVIKAMDARAIQLGLDRHQLIEKLVLESS
jgi:hypothetical protein